MSNIEDWMILAKQHPNIKDWLILAKQHNLRVTNEASTDDLSLCINLLSIPTANTVAVTVTFLKNQRKKNAAPPWSFAKVMGVLENIMREIDDEGDTLTDRFQPVDLSLQWYRTLDCHRIFFITETSLPSFISTLLRQNRLNLIKIQGVTEIRLIADAQQYCFNIKI